MILICASNIAVGKVEKSVIQTHLYILANFFNILLTISWGKIFLIDSDNGSKQFWLNHLVFRILKQIPLQITNKIELEEVIQKQKGMVVPNLQEQAKFKVIS